MKAKNIDNISSSPAPKEWEEIPEIKAGKPKLKNREISLHKIDGFNICAWTVKTGAIWARWGDYFIVKK